MIPIQLNFPDGRTKNFLLPTGFDQLSQEQYLATIAIIKQAEREPSKQWMLLIVLAKMSIPDIELLNAVQRIELLSTLEFIYDFEKLPSKCMIKKVHVTTKRHGLVSLFGPGDVFKHLSFAEFIMAEGKLEKFEKTQSVDALDQLCGILYRPAAKDRKNQADKRQPYQEGMVEYFAEFFQQVDPDVKWAILMNYYGAKNMLPKMYKLVFPEPKKEEGEKPIKPKTRKSVSLSWLKTLSTMAERDVTKFKSIEAMPAHTVLFNLNETILQNPVK
ncbi:MAG: hypothetical protein ABIN80_23045 [Dyadobacter sp.]|uniref:hypothetical protein n=1 Tax=Dyadobacter sp. TaxID=1914288 RepID=UPI003263F75A